MTVNDNHENEEKYNNNSNSISDSDYTTMTNDGNVNDVTDRVIMKMISSFDEEYRTYCATAFLFKVWIIRL